MRLRYRIQLISDIASESEDEETPTSRFVACMLKHFLKGFQAKSKDVRFRCLDFVSNIVASLGELECMYLPFMYLPCTNTCTHQSCLIHGTEGCADESPSG